LFLSELTNGLILFWIAGPGNVDFRDVEKPLDLEKLHPSSRRVIFLCRLYITDNTDNGYGRLPPNPERIRATA